MFTLRVCKLVIAVCVALLVSAALCCAQNLVHNGDFEMQADVSPPQGWTMWGSEVYKTPANFTRDTVNPHGGDACFRIYHPANTAGYIVSSPEYAIRPRPGMMYTISFWARTDKPGASQFFLTAYESVRPFRDAPSPGSYNIDLTTDWQRFEFSIHEGWDFFAERSGYILLTFRTTSDAAAERTLWIDDVDVRESPSPREGRMIDESMLDYEPLQHRLRPGDRLAFSVDASKPARPAARRVGGISFHRVAGWTSEPYNREGKYTLHPKLEQAIGELQLPMTRFYAVGDEPFSVEEAIDKAATLVDKVGVPQDKTVLELETQGATSKLPPEFWARAVRHSVSKGYGFREWEIANEPYITRPDSAFATPDEYIAHVKQVSAAIRTVQPEAQVGVAINKHSTPWGNYILKQTAGSYDFVAAHHYAVSNIHRRKFEVASLTENYKVLDRALQINALIEAYNPGREVYQLDTEWGMHSGGPDGERADGVNRNANIWGTIHRAVRMIYYLREGMLRGASSWQMLNRVFHQGFGILAQEEPDKRFMLYWLYYYFNRHAGSQVLDTDGTCPWYTPAEGDDPYTKAGEYPGPLTPVVVTLSEDGSEMYLIAANGSWETDVQCEMTIRNFQPASAEGTVLSNPDPDGAPLLERTEDAIADLPVKLDGGVLTCTLPAHSAAFITLAAR